MNFYKNQIFHIYNQGNNKQEIFFTDENYKFFLWKMKAYLLPFGDIIAYCLMPNHFHILFYVKNTEVSKPDFQKHLEKVENERRSIKHGNKAILYTNHWQNLNPKKSTTLNKSIGYMQRTFTRSINNEQGRTGSLFRETCKAKDGWIDEFVTHDNQRTNFNLGKSYAADCLHYIHNNPVRASLVNKSSLYKYSSAREYEGLRKTSICNVQLGKELLYFD